MGFKETEYEWPHNVTGGYCASTHPFQRILAQFGLIPEMSKKKPSRPCRVWRKSEPIMYWCSQAIFLPCINRVYEK